MSPNQYVSDLRAEVAALRAVVARVEELAGELAKDNDYPGFEADPDYWAGLSEASERIRIALGSTDSDPGSDRASGRG